MQTERTFIDDLKHQYRHGGMTMKLMFINIAVFLVIRIIGVFMSLGGIPLDVYLGDYVQPFVGLHTDLGEFARHPWGLFTYMFVHFDFWHILMNMFFFYFAGKMFEQLFDQKRLLYTYLMGGIFGGLLEIIAHAIFPRFELFSISVVGASASVMAVFIAMAFYRPNLKVMFFGILPVRLIILAGIFLLKDLLNLSSIDGTAHFAHLGGAILGMISVQQIHSSGNLINRVQQFGDWVERLFSKNKNPRMKVRRSNKSGSQRVKTDEEYNMEAKDRQEQIDRILDKISKSGYESLTKKEKDFLFNQSKK